jgi:integrase
VRSRRTFGTLRRLPSKRWQASYIGPDDQRHVAPSTFTAKIDAEAWLADERRLTEQPNWRAPDARQADANQTLRDAQTPLNNYAASWLVDQDLRPLTRRDYDSLLRNHILPTLGPLPITGLTKGVVRSWYSKLPKDRPRARSKALQLLHAILNNAVDTELLDANPAALGRRIGARPRRAKKVRPLSVEEINTIAKNMPDRLRLAVLLGCWCALRYGELAELRRKDVDMDGAVLRIQRGVIRLKGQYVPSQPKTEAGVRDVHIPAFLIADLKNHQDSFVDQSGEALLFPAQNGQHLHSSTFARHFAKAATAAGRPDATPHFLRHTGASLATSAGATTADVMARLGHTTPAMAMVYQHSLDGADARVANALSQLGTELAASPKQRKETG